MAATMQVVLRTDKENARGEAPLYLRIIKHRKVSNLSTGIRLQTKCWDDAKKRVKPSHPNSARLNALLNKLITEYSDKLLEAEQQQLTISVKSLKEKITGSAAAEFFAVGNEMIQRYLVAGKIGTRDLMRSVLKNVKDFIRSDKPFLTDITEQWLRKYEEYLIETLHNKPNTVHRDMKNIRRVFNEAVRRDLIGSEHNPFSKYKFKADQTHREHLTMEELNRFAVANLPVGNRLALTKDMFVFSAYAGGLRISDVLLLRWGNLADGRVVLRIRKTGTPTAFRAPDVALAIVSKYRTQDSTAQDLVFPTLPAATDFDSTEALDQE